jgi:Tol biopolymer transport system component
MRRIMSRAPAAAAVAVLCTAAAAPADAQYFGRNKVQYEQFDFNVLSTEHFDLHYYPAASGPTRDAAFMAERWYTRLAGVLSHEMLTRQQLILYADHSDFQQTNVIDGTIDESTGGVTESLQRRVVMPLTPSYRESDQILGHELVHAFQYDIAARNGGVQRLSRLPLWAIEGMAEYLSTGRHDVQTATWLRDAVLHDDVPTLRKLTTDSRYFPYRFGAGVWAWVGGRFGDERVGEIFAGALRDGMGGAIQRVLGISSDSLAVEWVADVKAAYAPLLEGRTHPDSVGRRLGTRDDVNQLMLGPAVSPDGRHVVFAWARGFSLDLYLADAHSGRVIRRLVRGSSDPHYDAVSFTGSAGSWSPDGSRFAAVVFAGGNQQLALIDITSARVEQRITVPRVGLITTPAWSPDGRSIAFSGMAGGVSDLYLVDVTGSEVRQLTADRYADLQPNWSPDGRSLAFVTDRADAALFESLERATKRIAIIDLATGAIRGIEGLPAGSTVNPQFSPDGTDLYFLAEPDGFRDIYRMHLPTGELFRVTRTATGITGLTSYSPALSVATSTGDLVFSIFNRRGYVLAALTAEQAGGAAVDAAQLALDPTAGLLLPFAAAGRVERYLADAHTGMPDSTHFANRGYAATPKLSYVGMPSLGINYDAFGVAVYANMSGYFTDVLGRHSLYVQGMMNGGWKELGGQALYESRDRRLNWAVSAGRLPYVTRYMGMYPVTVNVNGRPTAGSALDEYSERLIINQGRGMARYPLSATKRLEFGAGLSHITYSAEINRIVSVGPREVMRDRIPYVAPVSYTLWQASAALVGDHSSFGIASPMDGGRYRLEIQPTVGTLNVNTISADWRTYRLLRPVTLAARASHYGRYGSDADRPELGTMFIGGPGMVRGYSYESFTTADCIGSGTNRCALLDRLLGSSIALASVELRVPLLGSGRYALLDFNFVPTELALFADAGAAWSRSAGPALDGARGPVASAGISSRFNVFGMLIVETYYAVPFQRSTGARFGVQFVPGW